MEKDIRRSVTIEAKKHGISGQIMKWLLKTQGRLEGVPGSFRASKEYQQYEHSFMDNYGYCYDSQFFEGVDYSEKAIQKAEMACSDYNAERNNRANNCDREYQETQLNIRTKSKKSILSKILEHFH